MNLSGEERGRRELSLRLPRADGALESEKLHWRRWAGERESFRFQWDRGCELVIPTMSTQRGGTYVERKAEVEIGDIGGHFHHP